MQVRYKPSIVNTIQEKELVSPETGQQKYYKDIPASLIDLNPLGFEMIKYRKFMDRYICEKCQAAKTGNQEMKKGHYWNQKKKDDYRLQA